MIRQAPALKLAVQGKTFHTLGIEPEFKLNPSDV